MGTHLFEEERESQGGSERYGDQGWLNKLCRDFGFYSG